MQSAVMPIIGAVRAAASACGKGSGRGAGTVRKLYGIDDTAPPCSQDGFSIAPGGLQIYTADGPQQPDQSKFREIVGSDTAPGDNALRDERRPGGRIDLIRRAFSARTVTHPGIWYDPRDVDHVCTSPRAAG